MISVSTHRKESESCNLSQSNPLIPRKLQRNGPESRVLSNDHSERVGKRKSISESALRSAELASSRLTIWSFIYFFSIIIRLQSRPYKSPFRKIISGWLDIRRSFLLSRILSISLATRGSVTSKANKLTCNVRRSWSWRGRIANCARAKETTSLLR